MVTPNQRSLPSLRLWLQSTTLLAVIAGYALLLGVNRSLNQAQRLDDHLQLVEALLRDRRTIISSFSLAILGPAFFVGMMTFVGVTQTDGVGLSKVAAGIWNRMKAGIALAAAAAAAARVVVGTRSILRSRCCG